MHSTDAPRDFEFGLVGLVGTICLLTLLALGIGLLDASDNPELYERVHGERLTTYVRRSMASMLAFAAGLTLGIARLAARRRQRLWATLFYGWVAAFILYTAVSLVRWAATGFDH